MLDWHADLHRQAMDGNADGVNRANREYLAARQRLLDRRAEADAEIARLAAERDRYRDTLGWYAEANTYRGEMAWEAGIPFYRNEPISNDIGQRARDALRGPTNAARG